MTYLLYSLSKNTHCVYITLYLFSFLDKIKWNTITFNGIIHSWPMINMTENLNQTDQVLISLVSARTSCAYSFCEDKTVLISQWTCTNTSCTWAHEPSTCAHTRTSLRAGQRDGLFVLMKRRGAKGCSLFFFSSSGIFKTATQRKFYANWQRRRERGVGGLTGFRDSGMGKYSENEEEEFPGGQRGREGLTWTGGSGGKADRGRAPETERLLLMTQIKSMMGRTVWQADGREAELGETRKSFPYNKQLQPLVPPVAQPAIWCSVLYIFSGRS